MNHLDTCILHRLVRGMVVCVPRQVNSLAGVPVIKVLPKRNVVLSTLYCCTLAVLQPVAVTGLLSCDMVNSDVRSSMSVVEYLR